MKNNEKKVIDGAVKNNDRTTLSKDEILLIGEPFGLDESYLSEGEITLSNIFSNSGTYSIK